MLEHVVAGAVAPAIVDGLEAVEVEQDERQRLLVTGGAAHLFVEPQHQIASVVAVCQRILERELLEPCTAHRDRRVGRERSRDVFEAGMERNRLAVGAHRVDQLQHAQVSLRGVAQRHRQHRMSAISSGQVDPPVERVRRVARYVVGFRHVDDLAGVRDVAGEARHVQGKPLDLQPLLHFGVAEPPILDLGLDHREAEMGALTQEERRRFRAGEPARLHHDSLEHGGELALAADRDSKLKEVFDHLDTVVGGGCVDEPQEPRISDACSRDVHDREERARGMPGSPVLETTEIPVKLGLSEGADRSAPVSF